MPEPRFEGSEPESKSNPEESNPDSIEKVSLEKEVEKALLKEEIEKCIDKISRTDKGGDLWEIKRAIGKIDSVMDIEKLRIGYKLEDACLKICEVRTELRHLLSVITKNKEQ